MRLQSSLSNSRYAFYYVATRKTILRGKLRSTLSARVIEGLSTTFSTSYINKGGFPGLILSAIAAYFSAGYAL